MRYNAIFTLSLSIGHVIIYQSEKQMHRIKFTIEDIIRLLRENRVYFITYECYKSMVPSELTYNLKLNNADYVVTLSTASLDNIDIIKTMHENELSFQINFVLSNTCPRPKTMCFNVIYHENGYSISLNEDRKGRHKDEFPELEGYALKKIQAYNLVESV